MATRSNYDVLELLKRLTASLMAEMELVQELPHSGEAGRAVEDAMRALLARHLPSRFSPASGFVFDTTGVGTQSDILVIDDLTCPRLVAAKEVGIFPVDAVVARIECTQTIDRDKARDDCKRIVEFRKMKGIWPNSLTPAGWLLAAAGPKETGTVAEWLIELWREASPEDRKSLPSGIMIPGRCLAMFAKGAASHADASEPADKVEEADRVTCIAPTEGAPDFTLVYWLDRLVAQAEAIVASRIQGTRLQRDMMFPQLLRYIVAEATVDCRDFRFPSH